MNEVVDGWAKYFLLKNKGTEEAGAHRHGKVTGSGGAAQSVVGMLYP